MKGEITIRDLEIKDLELGFFEVLSQLTTAPKLSHEQFSQMLDLQRQQDVQKTVVGIKDNKVIATGSIFIEQKFIRSGAPCGHIEDIVVDGSCRGLHLGRDIIHHLVVFAKGKGCYKVILDCADCNVSFYEKCGFVTKEQQMVMYF